jgi:hypothetical protein
MTDRSVSISEKLYMGLVLLIAIGILGGIVLLAIYKPWDLLDIIIAIIGLVVLAALWGMLLNFPRTVERWPDWLRWGALLPGATISVIVAVFLCIGLIDHIASIHLTADLKISDLVNRSDSLRFLSVIIVGALCAFICAMLFIVSGTNIAPRFRFTIAILLSVIASGVDFVLFLGLGMSPYSGVIFIAGIVGVVVAWQMLREQLL